MKTNLPIIKRLALIAPLVLNLQFPSAFAQGTAFTYEGQLQNNGSPASGTYNLTFTLFDTNSGGTSVAGPVTNSVVQVTNGLFTVLVDFGPSVFTGETNWLEIAVETNGGSSFTTLAPRQQLTPTPYAIYAESAGGLSGTLSASQLTSIGNTTGGSLNFFVGPSGNSTMSGANNTANGFGALSSNTSGSQNTAVGTSALVTNTTGAYNTAEGTWALNANTSGSQNTAVGTSALLRNTTGANNTGVGDNALFSNASGANNTANGVNALSNSTTGSNNIALGYQAGVNYSGNESGNIDIGNPGVTGENDIIRIGSSQSQTFIAGAINGNGAGLTNLNASQLANGTLPSSSLPVPLYLSGSNTANTISGINEYIGYGSGVCGLGYYGVSGYGGYYGVYGEGDSSVGVYGTGGIYGVEGYGSTGVVGYGTTGVYGWTTGEGGGVGVYGGVANGGTGGGVAGYFEGGVGITGTLSVGSIVGDGSGLTSLDASQLTSNTEGGGANFYVGPSGNWATTGSDNTANGSQALQSNTSGSWNTANGANALNGNTSGSDNTANGGGALQSNTSGSDNTANGFQAIQSNTNGAYNTADGFQALQSNTSGSWNTANGANALNDNTSGWENTAYGAAALLNNTSGSNNIALGPWAGQSIISGSHNIDIGNQGVTGDNNVIRIGDVQTATYLAGIHGVTSSGGSAVYVNSSGQLGTSTSSRRYKEAIQDMGGQSDVLLSLRPVAFRYKPEIDPQALPQFGLVAEEVEQVDPDLVVHDRDGKPYSVRYEQVNAMLLNEFQKEHHQVEEQKVEIKTLKEKNDSLAERLNELEATVNSLAKKSNGGGQ